MVASINNTMHPFLCNLICHISAAITKNTTGHVQLYVWTNIFSFKCSAGKLVTGGRDPKLLMDIHSVSDVNKPGIELSELNRSATSADFNQA